MPDEDAPPDDSPLIAELEAARSRVASLEAILASRHADEAGQTHGMDPMGHAASQDRFRFYIESAPMAVLVSHPDGNIIDSNQAASDLLGYPREQLRTMHSKEIIGPALKAFASEKAAELMDRKYVELEIPLLRGDQRSIWVHIRATVLENGHFLAYIQDISERKQFETEIRQKNEELALINALNDAVNRGESLDAILNLLALETRRIMHCKDTAIYLLDPDGQNLTMRFTNIAPEIQHKVERFIGKPIPQLILPIRPGGFFQKILATPNGMITQDKQVIQEWMAEFIETPFLSPAMRPMARKLIPQIFKLLHIRSTLTIPLISDGGVIGILDMSSQDLLGQNDLERVRRITGPVTAAMLRKQVEIQLQESEIRYRAIYEGSTEGILAVQFKSGDFLYANPAVCAMFGYPADEFARLKITDLHPHASSTHVLEEFDRINLNKKNLSAMIPCRRKDGSLFYADISSTAVELGEQTVVIGFFNDISERRRSDALLKARLLLSSMSPETSLDDLLQKTLDGAETITDSTIGYFHFVDEDEVTLSLQNWSTNTIQNMCSAEGKGQHYPVDQAGVWADAMRQRKAVIYNDYNALTCRKGMPAGHAAVTRFISVPVIRGEKIVALMGVGNKEVAYDERDVEVVTLLVNEAWDIILRKRAETALQESEELHRTLIESQESVIAMVDQEGIFCYVNQTAAESTSTTPREMVGKAMSDIFPAEYAQRQLGAIREVIRTKNGMVVEARTMVQGRPRWYRTSIQPIRDSNGSVSTALINSVDITIHKEMETILEEKVGRRTAEIQAVRQRLELATRSAGIGIWETNYKTGEMIWDEQMFKVYNVARDSFHGVQGDWKQRVHPDDLPAQEALLAAALCGECDYVTEFRILWPDQSEHTIGSNGIVTFSDDGQPERMIGIDHDITARKQAEIVQQRSEEVLRQANDQLGRAMRMKDEFLASMSHELRTPLTGILGLSEALQMETYGELNSQQTTALAHIESSGQHLLNLINDILDVSKIEAGKLELQFDLCSLGDICQASLQLVKGLAEKKHLKLGFAMDPAGITLSADMRRLKQILVNLLTNAIKFTPEGGSLGLLVSAEESQETIRLTVWDKGIGIQPEDLRQLFKPFVQVDSSLSRQQAGTGLGLVLVQRLTDLHGGSVEVESTPGEGSRFSVILPWVRSTAAGQDPRQSDSLIPLQRAMTVEDDEFDAEHLSRYLKILGVENIVYNCIHQANVEQDGLHQPEAIGKFVGR